MRILHIVQSLDAAWGGIARVLPELCAELTTAGDSCRVATLAGGRYGSPPRLEGAEILAFEACPGGGLGRSREFDRRIGELVSWSDVVHLHGLWTGQNWSAGHAARRAGRPYLMTPHSMMMPWAWHRSWWKKRPAGWLFEHRNLRAAARLHALAEGEAAHMRRMGFNERIEVLPNGIRVESYGRPAETEALVARFPALSGRRWLLMLGRIHPQKGIAEGMQACFDVLASAAGWTLIVAGPDEVGMRPMLEAAVMRKGLRDRVVFTGMLSREEVRAALAGSRLLLQASRSEGLSLSIVEALAGGLPVLISPACNMPEVEAAGAGRVVEPGRKEIAAGLRALVGLPEAELAAMGQRGRELARRLYDWSVLTPRYRQLYAAVAAGR